MDDTRMSPVVITGERHNEIAEEPCEHMLTPEEIDRLPILPAGAELAEQAVYIDVMNLAAGPFRALPGQTCGSGHGIVAEIDTDPATWDRLCRCAGHAALAAQAERNIVEAELADPVS